MMANQVILSEITTTIAKGLALAVEEKLIKYNYQPITQPV
jgi:hypothetical protein